MSCSTSGLNAQLHLIDFKASLCEISAALVQIEGDCLVGSQIHLIVGTIVVIINHRTGITHAIDKHNAADSITVGAIEGICLNDHVSEFFVGGPAFAVLFIDIANSNIVAGILSALIINYHISAARIVDTDRIQVQVVASVNIGVIKVAIVCCSDHHAVGAVIKTLHLNDGNLPQSIFCTRRNSDPFTGCCILGITVIGINDQAANSIASFIKYLHNDGAGLVAGCRNHVKACTCEGKRSSTIDSIGDGDLSRTTHRDRAHILVCTIVTVVVVSIVNAGHGSCAGTVRSLSTICRRGIGGPAGSFRHVFHVVHSAFSVTGCSGESFAIVIRRKILAANKLVGLKRTNRFVKTCVGIQIHKLIFIVDRGCGDDGDLGVQMALLRRGILIIFHIGLVVEDHRSLEDHIALLKADLGIVLDVNGIAIDGQIIPAQLRSGGNTAVHDDIAVCILAEANAGDRVIGDQVILSDIDQHIQAEVHDHGILNQRRLPDDSESDGGIVEVEAIQHDFVVVVIRCLRSIGAVGRILDASLGVVNLGGIHIRGSQIVSVQTGLQRSEDLRLGATTDDEVVENGCAGVVAVNMQLIQRLLIIDLVIAGKQSFCKPVNAQLAVCSDLAVFTLVPHSGLGVEFGNEGSVSEVDHLACLVDGLTGSIDQVEHIGNLCAGPGLLGNGHHLQAILTLEVGVGQVCIIVGLISAGFNFIGGTNFRSRTLQIQEVAQCIFCSIQLFYGPVQHAGSGIVNKVGSCNDHILGHVGIFVHVTAGVCAGGHVEPLVSVIAFIGGLDAVGDEVVAIVANRCLRSIAAISSPVVDGALLAQSLVGKYGGIISGTIAILGGGQSIIGVLQVQLDNRSLLSGTLVISVQGVLQELNVEVVGNAGDILGAFGDIEDHGVTIIDLVFHLDVGSCLQNGVCNGFERCSSLGRIINAEDIDILTFIACHCLQNFTSEVIMGADGSQAIGSRIVGTGGHARIRAGATRFVLQQQANSVDRNAVRLHMIGPVLCGQIILPARAGGAGITANIVGNLSIAAGIATVISVAIATLIGSRTTVRHEYAELLAVIANTVSLGSR